MSFMSKSDGTLADGSHKKPSAPRVAHLSRFWLTVSLAVVLLVPLTLAATVLWIIPSSPEPLLDVEIHFEPVAWPPNGGADVRSMPGVRLRNPTEETWRNLSMTINGQFYFYSPEPLVALGDFSVPLAFFKTSGNKSFQSSTPIERLTVYAQIASGRRAIRDYKREVPGQ